MKNTCYAVLKSVSKKVIYKAAEVMHNHAAGLLEQLSCWECTYDALTCYLLGGSAGFEIDSHVLLTQD